MRPLSVVLASGGMDSCVTLALAREKGDLAMLHVTYGQRTSARERRAFDDLVTHYQPRHVLVVDVDHFRMMGGSSLTDIGRCVQEHDPEFTGVPDTYVPFRNGNLLAMAVSWAETLHAQAVYLGAVEEDSSGYPDCCERFIRAFEKCVELGTRPETRISVEAPLLHLSKAKIVRVGMALGAPLHLTWSCYRASDRACGVCDSCVLRLRGFQQAGVVDPIPYDPKPKA